MSRASRASWPPAGHQTTLLLCRSGNSLQSHKFYRVGSTHKGPGRHMAKQAKYVYSFGGGKGEGHGGMKELLGGKGANLAEMAGHPDLRLPVPPGFTLTTEVCTFYYAHGRKYPSELKEQVTSALKRVENAIGRSFGDDQSPLLFSVRSGARSSMPGMMETVLNV